MSADPLKPDPVHIYRLVGGRLDGQEYRNASLAAVIVFDVPDACYIAVRDEAGQWQWDSDGAYRMMPLGE